VGGAFYWLGSFPPHVLVRKLEHRRVVSESVAFPSTGTGDNMLVPVPGRLPPHRVSQSRLGAPTLLVRERRHSYTEVTMVQSVT
jgi:hypothetical protein